MSRKLGKWFTGLAIVLNLVGCGEVKNNKCQNLRIKYSNMSKEEPEKYFNLWSAHGQILVCMVLPESTRCDCSWLRSFHEFIQTKNKDSNNG